MSSNSTFNCFGLVIHGYGKPQILAYVDEAVAQGRQTMIVTANPEILLYAKNHADYWNILRQADLRTVDSFGLVCAGLLHKVYPTRTTGVDLADAIIKRSAEKGWKVALVGGSRQVTGAPDKAAWKLRQAYPELQILPEELGSVAPDGEDGEVGNEVRYRLTHFAPDVLLVGLGHPRQEAWLVRYLHDFPSVKVAIGVGGTLDFWSGEIKRAPEWMRKIGMEWLYRLIKEPKRWRRIFTALIVFPLMAFFDSLSSGETK